MVFLSPPLHYARVPVGVVLPPITRPCVVGRKECESINSEGENQFSCLFIPLRVSPVVINGVSRERFIAATVQKRRQKHREEVKKQVAMVEL